MIEVVVSILFLSIAIVGLSNTYSYMSSRVEIMRWKRDALHLAQEQVEECMANPNYMADQNQPIEIRGYTIKLIPDPNDNSIECIVTPNERKDVSVSLKTILGK